MLEEDAQLVRRIARSPGGARDAETELCRRFGRRAVLYGMRHLRDADRARELAQSVLLAVLVAVRRGSVAEPDHLDRFVLGTCRNIAGRMREAATRETPTEEAGLDVVAVLPEMETIDTGALLRCLASLDERSRQVVHLSFHEDRSADEIAIRLETTRGNVRVLRHRAVARLRRCLDSHPEEAR